MIRETGVKQKLAIGKSEEDEKNFSHNLHDEEWNSGLF